MLILYVGDLHHAEQWSRKEDMQTPEIVGDLNFTDYTWACYGREWAYEPSCGRGHNIFCNNEVFFDSIRLALVHDIIKPEEFMVLFFDGSMGEPKEVTFNQSGVAIGGFPKGMFQEGMRLVQEIVLGGIKKRKGEQNA